MPAKQRPEIVYRNGEPVAVILDIRRYEELLERLEDAKDLEALRQLRSKPLRFRTLDQFLEAHAHAV